MLAVTFLVFIAACPDCASVLYTGDLPTPANDTVVSAEPEGPGHIVEVATDAGTFATLIAAVDVAGLASTLSDESPTVLAAPLLPAAISLSRFSTAQK